MNDKQVFYFIRKGEHDVLVDDFGRVQHATKSGIQLETIKPKIVLTHAQYEEFVKLHDNYDDVMLALITLDRTSPELYGLLSSSSSMVENNYTVTQFCRVYALYNALNPLEYIHLSED
jgi:hypothetical protein